MRKLILKTLVLLNFKGQSSTIKIDGKDAMVFGDNGTGKTTLYDALCWLLFDKDSQFKSTFEIKNLNATGQTAHNLSHEVQAAFEFDGRAVELRKVYSETWTKKRGSSAREMTGHTTDHYIDGVPINKREYQQRIAEIATEEQFKLLTSPFYFAEKMKWQDRRALLMELCGDVTDADVIAGNDDLADLKTILNGRSFDDHKKVIAARRTEINNALTKTPVRIDEVVKGMADCTGINHLEEISRIESLAKEVAGAEAKLLALENGGGLLELKQQLAVAETEALQARNAYQGEADKLQVEQNQQIANLRQELRALDDVGQDNAAAIKRLNNEKAERETENANLRAEWATLDAPTDTADLCPCCGQLMPEALKEAALAENNLRISNRKAAINKQGGENKARIDVIITEIDKLATLDQANAEARNELAKKISALDLVDIATDIRLAAPTAMVTATREEVEQLTQKIAATVAGHTDNNEITALQENIDAYKASITASQNKIAIVEATQKARDRKVELEAEEKGLATEFEKLEAELFLMDSFTRAKVEMLEDKINGMFAMTRFKLFAEQINGGLAECCSVTHNGVPFETSLNTGAKINAGLDIINTIIKAQGLSLPICIDNSESVTALIPVAAQVIQLIVSAADKKLRVEIKGA